MRNLLVENKRLKTPGPGTYDLRKELFSNVSPIWGNSNTERFFDLGKEKEEWPGPGQYIKLNPKFSKNSPLFNRFKESVTSASQDIKIEPPKVYATMHVLRANTPKPKIKGLRGEFVTVYPKTLSNMRASTPMSILKTEKSASYRPGSSMGQNRSAI